MGDLKVSLERRGEFSRWVVHGELKRKRFDLEGPAAESGIRALLERTRLESVDFSGLVFDHFYAAGASFIGCDFSDTRFAQLGFGQPQIQRSWGWAIRPGDPRYAQTVYEACLFRKTRFDPDNTHFGNARFVRCVFDQSWLRNLIFTHTAEFLECRFVGKVIECNFWGDIEIPDEPKRVGRTTNEFRGNDFREADLIWVGFHHIDLDAQQWPESGEYAIVADPQRRIEAGIDQAQATLSAEDMNHILPELNLLARLYNDERQVLVRRSELARRTPPHIQQKLWEFLTSG
ncbi:MAG: hypothetical protein M3082_12390 [Candidatus Dormibacteraeota bacterium]|nr:hypothetical protein [Candidatus Dormibacteraeota bacterium]